MSNLLTLEVKDEILEGQPLYTIKDNNGNVVYDNVQIELKTSMLQEGTPLNKALFDVIDDNFKKINSKDKGNDVYDYFVNGLVDGFGVVDTLNTKYRINEFDDRI